MTEGWRTEDDSLVRDLEFADFKEALAFVNEVGRVAEEANHHPDIAIFGWNKVRLVLSTHSAGRVTDADHALAATIDGLLGA